MSKALLLSLDVYPMIIATLGNFKRRHEVLQLVELNANIARDISVPLKCS